MNSTASWLRKATFVFLSAVLFSLPATTGYAAPEDDYCLSVTPPRHDPGERIMAFYFKIFGGEITGFPRVPHGWTINISNGPAAWAHISGKAVHGGEFLPLAEFAKIVVFITELPEDMRGFPGAPKNINVTGYVDMYHYIETGNLETTRRAELSNAAFAISHANQRGPCSPK